MTCAHCGKEFEPWPEDELRLVGTAAINYCDGACFVTATMPTDEQADEQERYIDALEQTHPDARALVNLHQASIIVRQHGAYDMDFITEVAAAKLTVKNGRQWYLWQVLEWLGY
jgi:hypothetical protein